MPNEMTTHHPDVIDVTPSHQHTDTSGLILDDRSMDSMMRMAKMMAEGRATIPSHLQRNTSDCLAVVTQAVQWGMNPFAVAQKTHVTQGGALGYEAQLINAVVISRAPIVGRPEFEFIGDWSKVLGKVEERKSDKGGKYYVATYTKADEAGLGVVCSCQMKGEAEPRAITIMMSQAYPRFSTQWATDPQQQITYLAIRKWARRYTPDVILGVYTPEELEETTRGEIDITPQRNASPAQLANAAHAVKPELTEDQKQWVLDLEDVARTQGLVALQEIWGKTLTKEDRKAIGAAELERFKTIAQNADDDRAVAAKDAAEAAAAAGDAGAQDE
jgi:hypothetical protein